MRRWKLSEQNFENFTARGRFSNKTQKLLTKFPGLATSGCHNSAMIRDRPKITTKLILYGLSSFTMELLQKIQWNTCHQMAFLAFRFYKVQFRPGLCPAPRWGAYNAVPDLIGWRKGYPLPFSVPSTPETSRLGGAFGIEKRTLKMPHKPNFWIRPWSKPETSRPVERLNFYLPHLHLVPPLGWSHRNFVQIFCVIKL